jgi:hypothetical protein
VVAEIADGGDATAQRDPAGVRHRRHDLVVPAAVQVADRVGARVEGQVDMGVDQTPRSAVSRTQSPGITPVMEPPLGDLPVPFPMIRPTTPAV